MERLLDSKAAENCLNDTVLFFPSRLDTSAISTEHVSVSRDVEFARSNVWLVTTLELAALTAGAGALTGRAETSVAAI